MLTGTDAAKFLWTTGGDWNKSSIQSMRLAFHAGGNAGVATARNVLANVAAKAAPTKNSVKVRRPILARA